MEALMAVVNLALLTGLLILGGISFLKFAPQPMSDGEEKPPKKIPEKAANSGAGKATTREDPEPETYTEEELKDTAIHEAGHAVVSLVLSPHVLDSVWIFEKGFDEDGCMGALENDDIDYAFATREEAEGEVAVLYAGLAAEELYTKGWRGGSTSDMKEAVRCAANIIQIYGVKGKIPMDYDELSEHNLCHADVDEMLASEADRILNEGYGRAKEILQKRSKLLQEIATALVERKNLTRDELLELERLHPE